MLDWEGVPLDRIADGRDTVRQPEAFRRIVRTQHRSLSESLVEKLPQHVDRIAAADHLFFTELDRHEQADVTRTKPATGIGCAAAARRGEVLSCVSFALRCWFFEEARGIAWRAE